MRAAEIRARLMQPWAHGQAEDFRGLIVTELLDLSGLNLAGVDFSATQFHGGVQARDARFDGLSWFTNCWFADADFSGAVFMNDARFEGSVFEAAPLFQHAEFRGITGFDRATLPGGDFRGVTCYGNAGFAEIRAGDLRFDGAEFLGGFWAQSAQFGPATRFDDTQVHGRLWLRGATRANAMLRPSEFGLTFGYSWT